MAERTYSREEMEEIFRRAAEHTQFAESSTDAIRYDDLVAAAREVGIDPRSVADVAQKVEAERALVQRRNDDEAIVREALSERRLAARRGLLTYTIVTAFLVALDWMTPGGPWAQWVALIWGLFATLGFARALLEPSQAERERILAREHRRRQKREQKERRERAAEQWKQRLLAQQEAIQRELRDREAQQREQERKRREDQRKRREASRELEAEFEHAVEEGVTRLLTVLAKRISDAAREEPAPRGDFGAYVTRERAKERGSSTAPAPPRVRVEAPRPAEDPSETSDETEAESERGSRGRRERNR